MKELKKTNTKEEYKYIDVDNLKQLPKLSEEKRYLEFLGGTKEYRCFIVDKNLPRCDFYKNNSELITDFLQPIYKNHGIVVAQDNTFPIPGFYILSYDKQYNSIDELPNSLIIRTISLIKEIRKIMREKLNIKYVNIYYEEKDSKSNNVHYWIMPKIDTVNLKNKLYELDLKSYLESFKFQENKTKIIKYNKLIKEELLENYKRIDDAIFNNFESNQKKINLCISNRCFIKCKGCYNNFCKEKEEISYQKVEKFLEYAKFFGLTKVTLSGGDPFARKDISKIIKKCLDLDLKVNIDTTGFNLISDENIVGTNEKIDQFKDISLLKKVSNISIPLDGSNNETISKFRISKENLYKKTIRLLEFFEKEDIKTGINTVFHKENMNDMNNIYEILKKYKCIKKWQVFQYMPIGPLGKKNEAIFKVEDDKFDKNKEQFEKLSTDQMKIEFKSAKQRSKNYMLVNSIGTAYRVDLNNKIETFGNVGDSETWENILKNI